MYCADRPRRSRTSNQLAPRPRAVVRDGKPHATKTFPPGRDSHDTDLNAGDQQSRDFDIPQTRRSSEEDVEQDVTGRELRGKPLIVIEQPTMS